MNSHNPQSSKAVSSSDSAEDAALRQVVDSDRGAENPIQLIGGPEADSAELTGGHEGSLRSKVVLSLASLFAVFLVIAEIVRHSLIAPVFADLERDAALRDTHRVEAAIEVESDHLRAIVEQSAVRFDPIELMDEDQSGLALASKAVDRYTTWPIVGVEWAALAGSDGSWHWLHVDDQIKKLNNGLDTGQHLFPAVLKQVKDQSQPVFDGLTCAQRRVIYAYAAAPIQGHQQRLDSHAGYHLVIGNAIDNDAVQALKRRTQVDFSIQVYRSERTNTTRKVWTADESLLVVESPLLGSEDEIMANLFVQVPREVMQYSHKTTAVARNVFVFGAVASLIVLLLQLQRIVIGPLARIREHTERIAELGLEAGSLSVHSNDEIGALVGAFDRMKVHLVDTQKRLADASHAAGMSQVADTVIHNVGNVLTNVNSLIETATDRVEGLRAKPLQMLATRLSEEDHDPALQAATPDYLHKYATSLEEDQTELAELLATLNDNIQHIHGVIRDQRRHATKTIVKNRFSVTELIREAIGCCQSRLDRDNIAVSMPPSTDAEVETDRSLVLQIVINIISNARHAMRERACKTPTLDICLEQTQEAIQIHFRDNGCGMTQEVLEHIFEAHYTTKSTGSGLGLHFCAIALKRLGGSISVHSDGPYLGSTFVMQLPLANTQPIPLIVDGPAVGAQPAAVEALS